MSSRREVRRLARWGALAAAGVVLFAFDPSAWAFFPRCPLHALTGLFCPGCGAQRAVHALLHLDGAAALRHNALLVTMLPFVGYLEWQHFREPGRALRVRTGGLLALVAFTLAFFVLRNTAAFAFLAPPAG